MRILVNAFAAREGGGRWFTEALVQKLAEQNPDWYLLVFYADQSFVEGWSTRPNIELRYVPKAIRYRQRMFWQQWKLRRVVKKEKIELIFSPLNIGMFKPPVPQVTVQRNAHHVVPKVKEEEGGRWLRKRMELLGSLASIKSSAENIFVSKYMMELASHWLNPDCGHWHVVHNAINFDRLKDDAEPVTDYRYILSVGSLAPHKNVENIIKAFALLCRKKACPYKLVIVGLRYGRKHSRGIMWHEYLLKLSHDEGVGDKVVFWGPAQGENLASLYKHAEICIVPSFLESFGMVPGEALFCNKASVVSDIPVFHEVYGDAVLYCDPYSLTNMADMIVRLLEDMDLRQELIEKGKALLPNYNISVTAQNYANVMKLAVSNQTDPE